MALSISPLETFDFTAASTPLVGTIEGTTLVPAGGASVNTTDGLVLDGAAYRAASGTPPAAWAALAYPFTVVAVMKKIGEVAMTLSTLRVTFSSGSAWDLGWRPSGTFAAVVNGSSTRYPTHGINDGDTATVIFEAKADNLAVWVNGTAILNQAHIAVGTPSGANNVLLGHTAENTRCTILGMGYFSGASLTPDDRNQIQSDWRIALGLAAPSFATRPAGFNRGLLR